jgi:ubiquinone biosynthesis O-methyltransferase
MAAVHTRRFANRFLSRGLRSGRQPWDYLLPLHSLLRVLPELVPPPEFPDRTAPIDETLTSIDNDLYDSDSFADGWHNADHDQLASLQLLNPARVPFFFDALTRHARLDSAPADRRYLDVGCGGGVLTEALAARGCAIHGIDLSPRAVEYARGRAVQLALPHATYDVGSAYDLSPFPPASFDGVVMSDVLEHLHDLPRALGEVARVLKPGGVFVFDTINRTVLSYALTIVLAQELLRVVPPHTHDWRLYIRPEEASMLLQRHGFQVDSAHFVGMKPSIALSKLARGKLPLGDFYQAPEALRVNYLGWARRLPGQG